MNDHPLRIAQIIPSLKMGGAERFTLKLGEELVRQGHDVQVYVVSCGGPLQDHLPTLIANRVHILGKKFKLDARALFTLSRAFARFDPHVVHTHLFTALIWAALPAKTRRRRALIHTQHSSLDDPFWYQRFARSAVHPLVDRWVACSESVQKDAIARAYTAPDRLRTIDNGIDLSNRPVSSLDGIHLRIGTVGRMVPVKGHIDLIHAAGLLRDQGLPFTLTLIGDGPERAGLEAATATLGLGEHVVFAGESHQVPELLSQLDLFVLPSLSEGLPMSLLEAGAAGLPMVVTDAGGTAIVVQEGAGGFVVPPGDPQALSSAITRYAALPPQARRKLGQDSLQLVQDRYSITQTAEAYLDQYRQALDAR